MRPARAAGRACAGLAALFCLLAARSAQCQSYLKVNQLKGAMYMKMKGTGGCYKLLTATGVVGCEAVGGVTVTAELIAYADLPATLTADRTVVVSLGQLKALLAAVAPPGGSGGNPSYAAHVKGVLVDARSPIPAAFSSAAPFPLAAFAPYSPGTHVWNPAAGGSSGSPALNDQYFPFPIYLLTDELAEDATTRAAYNVQHVSESTHTCRHTPYCTSRHTHHSALRAPTPMPACSWRRPPPLTSYRQTLMFSPASTYTTHAARFPRASAALSTCRPWTSPCMRRRTRPRASRPRTASRWAGTACGRPCRRGRPPGRASRPRWSSHTQTRPHCFTTTYRWAAVWLAG